MRPLPAFIGVLLVGGIVLFAGCGAMSAAPATEITIPVEVLYGGSHCGPQSRAAGAVWVDRPADLPPLLNRPIPAKVLDSLQWNPETEGALWIFMGSQATGGFGLELASTTAIVQKAVATVQVQWRRPAPDRFVTQALTSPCLLLKLPKAGIDTIKIVDQSGSLRVQIQLP